MGFRPDVLLSGHGWVEEFVIDFTRFSERGLPCLKANDTDEYEGYLAVIDGDTLAGIYDTYGSRVLEGNVRAYLSARGKVNKGIQQLLRVMQKSSLPSIMEFRALRQKSTSKNQARDVSSSEISSIEMVVRRQLLFL